MGVGGYLGSAGMLLAGRSMPREAWPRFQQFCSAGSEHAAGFRIPRCFRLLAAWFLRIWILDQCAWEIKPAGCRILKVYWSIDQQLDFMTTRMDFGSSSQKFAEHDLNMQLDPGFHAIFACWLHVFSESEFWVSVHEKSSLLAAELRKSAYWRFSAYRK
jgi:hypothetical protein